MRVRAVGLNATIDLHDHHLIIHRRGDMFSGGPTELLVPLGSITSVQFRRPSAWRSGRIIIALDGAAAPKRGSYQQNADPTSVTFSSYHLPQFEEVLEAIQEAIATPSIEQMAMGAQRDRQERVAQARPQPTPTRAVVERIDPPRQSQYNPNTGADYHDTGSDGHWAYHNPGHGRDDLPPLNPSIGSWWRDMPLLGKIFLIGLVLIALVAMCSMPGEEAAPDPIEPIVDATEAAVAAPSDAPDAAMNWAAGDSPSLDQLVMDGDSRACSSPDTFATIRNVILSDRLRPGDLGVSRSELNRAIAKARIVITQVTVDNIRADIHEISCTAALDYGADDTLPITYQLRPDAQRNGDVMVYVDDVASLTARVLDGPLTEIRNRRQAIQAAAPNSVSDPKVDQPSDEDRYAPHAN